MNESICGLDVASTAARAAIINSAGVFVQELDVPASRAGEDQLLAVLPTGCIVILESTGRYHGRWARRLSRAGHRVYLINGLLAKRMATGKYALRDYKSDPIDARHLAQLGRLHLHDFKDCLFQENPARRRLLELCQVRSAQRTILTQCLSLAHHYLFSMLPEAEALDISFAQNQPLVDLFLRIDSLKRLRAMHCATIHTHLGNKAQAFFEMLKAPLNAETMFDAYLPALQAQLRLIDSLNTLLKELYTHIREAGRTSGRQHLIDLARSIPGFGEKSTPAIIACLPDSWQHWGSNRITATKLQAFFGFDPRVRSSGKWIGQVKMTKRGIALARTALYQASFCALRTDADLHATYAAQRAAGKHHDVAISHVMRRQLRRLVAVLKSGTPFVEHQSSALALSA
jgi:transposase